MWMERSIPVVLSLTSTKWVYPTAISRSFIIAAIFAVSWDPFVRNPTVEKPSWVKDAMYTRASSWVQMRQDSFGNHFIHTIGVELFSLYVGCEAIKRSLVSQISAPFPRAIARNRPSAESDICRDGVILGRAICKVMSSLHSSAMELVERKVVSAFVTLAASGKSRTFSTLIEK